jgi:hypothetical protein
VYTLGEAARASGKSKPTIAKAIRTGRLSAARGEDGTYQIDEAELHRVYPITGWVNGHLLRSHTPGATGFTGGSPATTAASELEKWKALAIEREETIRDLRADKEDLRRRLDQATALLTDQRLAKGTVPPGTLWGRFLAWRRSR